MESSLPPLIPLGERVIEVRGVPLAWTNDPPFVRAYAWVLLNLRFGPSLAPLNIQKLATNFRTGVTDARQALDQLVREGDLIVPSERWGKGRTGRRPSGGHSTSPWKWAERRYFSQGKRNDACDGVVSGNDGFYDGFWLLPGGPQIPLQLHS